MNKFENNLKELRLKNNINQRSMAKKLQISQSGYSKYEKGTAEPSFATLRKLAVMFNVSIDELIGFKEIKNNSKLINLDNLDETRSNLILNILNEDDMTIGRLEAFYQGIKLAKVEREEIINRIKGQKKND